MNVEQQSADLVKQIGFADAWLTYDDRERRLPGKQSGDRLLGGFVAPDCGHGLVIHNPGSYVDREAFEEIRMRVSGFAAFFGNKTGPEQIQSLFDCVFGPRMQP